MTTDKEPIAPAMAEDLFDGAEVQFNESECKKNWIEERSKQKSGQIFRTGFPQISLFSMTSIWPNGSSC